MQIFPYEFQRITGLGFDWLNQNWVAMDMMSELQDTVESLEKQRKHCIALTGKAHAIGNDYALKKRLQQLKADLLANRQPKVTKLQGFIKGREVDLCVIELIKQLIEYKSLKVLTNRRYELFDHHYQKAGVSAAVQLQELTKNEDFLKALLFSSRSLYRRCADFWQTSPENWKKKHRQTSTSLLKYLTRMSTKTTPYSRFTRLAMRKMESDQSVPAKNRIYLNTHLLPYFQDWLTNIPKFRTQMTVRLNPSLDKIGEEYRYILNSRNVESVQRVEVDAILDHIVEQFQGKGFVVEHLVNLLSNAVSASKLDLEFYLLELIDIGILEWEWNISALDSNWNDHLLQIIQSKSDFPEKENFVKVINELKRIANQLLVSDSKERAHLLDIGYRQVQTLAELSKQNNQANHVDYQSEAVFRRFNLNHLHVRPEQLFFEDCGRDPISDIPSDELNSLIRQLDRLVRAVCPAAVSHLRPVLLQYLQTNHPKGYNGPLLNIYEAFFRYYLGSEQTDEVANKPTNELQLWEDAVRRLAHYDDETNVHLQLDELVRVSEELFPFATVKSGYAGSAMLQVFQDDQSWKAYIDMVSSGYGKLGGRFLPLFPGGISREVRQWNLSLQGEQLWVENTDASCFNANVHPPLLKVEVRAPGSHQRLSSDQQIPVGELGVNFKPPSKIELLWRERTVSIFDLGFESWRSRSAMYRLLNCFGLEFPNWEWLRHRMGAIFLGGGGRQDGHVRIPRVTIGRNLVVQRQTWFFQVGQFPVPENRGTDTKYFLQVQQWQQQNDLPSRGFVTIQDRHRGAMEVAKNSSDDYKPQYIDLQHPLLVRLLGKLAKRTEQQLIFTEVLPAIPTVLNKGVINLEIERIIQWGGNP